MCAMRDGSWRARTTTSTQEVTCFNSLSTSWEPRALLSFLSKSVPGPLHDPVDAFMCLKELVGVGSMRTGEPGTKMSSHMRLFGNHSARLIELSNLPR